MKNLTLTREQQHYYGAVQRLAMILGRKYGVNVVFGSEPRTNGTTIHLPHWKIEDPALKNALLGLIVHEAAGHVAQTDFDDLRQWLRHHEHKPEAMVLKSISNICEDVRIELKIMESYPGARFYLDAAISAVFFQAPYEPEDCYWTTVVNWMLYRFRTRFLNQRLLQPMADQCDAHVRKMVPTHVLVSADMLSEKIPTMSDRKGETKSILQLAERLFDLFNKAAPSQTPPSPPPSTPQSANGDQQEGGDSDPSGDASSPGGSGGDGSSSGRSPSDPDSGSDAGGEGDGGQSASTQPGGGSGSDPSTGGQGTDEGDGSFTPIACSEDFLDSEIGDVFGDLKDLGASDAPLPMQVSTGGMAAGSGGGTADRFNASPSLAEAGPLRGSLTAALSPLLSGEVRKEIRRPHGRALDTRQLVLTKTRSQPRVFGRKERIDDTSAVVHLLVDRSSSTKGAVYQEITKATLGLTMALEAYPDVETLISHFPSATPAVDSGIITVKTPHESARDAARSWPISTGGTPLAEAYKGAALTFLASPKERRILIVITDGEPDSKESAFAARDFVSKLGIEIYGIVVSAKAYPLQLFDESEQVRLASEVPAAISRLVLRIL